MQENDYVKAGDPLCDGSITPLDILAVQGPTAVQEYLVNEIQEVYRLQGVKINDKHIEVIVRQMMQKVIVEESGDTQFLEGQTVDKFKFREENDKVLDCKVVIDAGDSASMEPGQVITIRAFREESSNLKRLDKKPLQVRDALPAVSKPTLLGITADLFGYRELYFSSVFPRNDQSAERSSCAC